MSELPRIELTAYVEDRAVARETFSGSSLRCTIGRGVGADFRVTSEGISRRHCQIVGEDGALILEDLGSSNGTYIAGNRITRQALVGAGEFTVCGWVIGYSIELPPKLFGRDEVLGADFARKGLANRTLQITPARDAARPPTRKVLRPSVRGHFVVAGAPGAPERVILLHKGTFSVGADKNADCVLERGPRMAALVLRSDNLFKVIDVSPKATSVKVNGEARALAPIYDEDVLEISGNEFVFRHGFPRLGAPPTQRMSEAEGEPERG